MTEDEHGRPELREAPAEGRRTAYEPPAITSLGSVTELTLGHSGSGSDGTFTGSTV